MPFVYTFRINIAIFADINAYTSHEKKRSALSFAMRCKRLITLWVFFFCRYFAPLPVPLSWMVTEFISDFHSFSVAIICLFSRSHTIWHSLQYILYIRTHTRTHSHGRLSCSHIRTIHHVFWSNDMFAHDRKNQFTLSKLFETTVEARTTHTYRCDSNIRHNFNRDQHAKQFTFCNKTPYNIGIELDGMAFFNSKLTA